MAQLTNDLKGDYQGKFDTCVIRPNRMADVDALVAQIAANKKRYVAAGNPVGTPWYVVGVIHALESSLNFGRHLHNGDPLTARTVQVPAGRPKTGQPPFTWEASASDALRFQGFDKWKDWSIPGTLFKLEGYNGFGYRDNHPDVPSPYLWSFSTHYSQGKVRGGRQVFADGGLGPMRGRSPAEAAGGEEPDRFRRRAEGRRRRGRSCALRRSWSRRRASSCSDS